MSLRALKIMVVKAVISDQFRMGIMNGQRAELLREYDLDPDEAAAVMAIRADTTADFYAAVERILAARDPRGRIARPADMRVGHARRIEEAPRHTAANVPVPA